MALTRLWFMPVRSRTDTHAVALPIYQTTAYTFDSVDHAAPELKEAGNIYSRMSDPTVALERHIARSMKDRRAGDVVGICGDVQHVLNLASEREIVSSICIYGGAINMMGVTLDRIGIKVRCRSDDLDAWEAAVNERTKAFLWRIGNPNANVADIGAIAEIAPPWHSGDC
ncbi:MAG: PLP-dependent transferase [Merdibacter sp.]